MNFRIDSIWDQYFKSENFSFVFYNSFDQFFSRFFFKINKKKNVIFKKVVQMHRNCVLTTSDTY
jgi:hypothetical protein